MEFTMNTKNITISLPAIVRVMDYHEFDTIMDSVNILNPDKKVIYTEIGFEDGQYVGLIHLDIDEHQEYAKTLINEFETME